MKECRFPRLFTRQINEREKHDKLPFPVLNKIKVWDANITPSEYSQTWNIYTNKIALCNLIPVNLSDYLAERHYI